MLPGLLPKAAPIIFPKRFHADNTYRIGFLAIAIVGFFGIGYWIMHHSLQYTLVCAVLTLLFFAGSLFILSLQITVNDAGLQQRHLFGRLAVSWPQIARMEKARHLYSLYGDDGKELTLLSYLSRHAQEAIAQETIRQAGLQPSHQILTYPVTEQWVRG